MRIWLAILAFDLAMTLPVFAQGGRFFLALESDVDQPAGSEVLLVTYASIADLLSNLPAAAAFTDGDLSPDWGVGGFANDSDQYHFVLESDNDQPTGAEVFLITYDSIADFVSNTPESVAFSQLNIDSGFSMGGFASDGDQYHLVLEPNDDSPVSDVFLITYASIPDFLSNTQVSAEFSALNIDSGFSVGGLTSDGDQYHLILESNQDQMPPSEVFLITYDSVADLLSNTQAGAANSQINIPPAWGIGGLAGLVPLFADGFESGDTSAWSHTVP